ncbi:MAG: GTP pyrophosphokinase family protein [Anaeroplasma sp.]
MNEVTNDILQITKLEAEEFFLAYKRMITFYECALLEVETKFKVLDKEYSNTYDRNPIEAIKTRIKSPNSIINKLQRKGYDISLNSIEECINDVAGIRIVCSFIDDVYNLAETFYKQDDIRIVKIKDYIKNPKKNGYRSLHLIVEIPIFLESEKRIMKVEVQLRTIAMDSWASLEHQLYYKKENNDQDIDDELYLCSILSNELDSKMNKLKRKIY